jgi:EmrB/QacA subfamily drug resistance transporter
MATAELRRQRGGSGWVLGLTSLALFMVVLDNLVVVSALPRMQADLQVGLATLQWTVNAYGIAFAAGVIGAAALGDLFGRRRVFVAGLAVFALASAACAVAPDASLLIVARTVQGLGGAAVLPLSLTILTAAFPPERRGAIVGVYGGLAGLAVASGPLVGGALTQGLDWHWIFWVNVPLGLLACGLSLRLLPESRGAGTRLDLPGAALVSTGAVALVLGLVRADGVGWASAQTLLALLGGAGVLLAFAGWERRAVEPMLPPRLLRNRAFVAGSATAFLMNGAIFGGAFLVTQYFQLARGYSPLQAGIRLLPFTLTPIAVAPVAGAVSDRIGRRPVIAAGLALQALGFGWVASTASIHAGYPALVLALLAAGVGISMALPTVPTAVLGAVEPAELGKASGVSTMMQRFGSVFAVAVASTVFGAFGHAGSSVGVTDGFRPALGVCALLSLVGAFSALGVRGRTHPAGHLDAAPAT